MSRQLINRSQDLKNLWEEGYSLRIKSGHLLVKNVPYVNSRREILRGTLVMKLNLAGDETARPEDHVAYFAGEQPCFEDGTEIEKIKNPAGPQTLAEGVVVDRCFSAKPQPSGFYPDFHAKVSAYVDILSGPAWRLDHTVSAKTSALVEPEVDESVFNYIDTASSRAGIALITKKLELGKVAIVGLGGTGSYVLDLVAKTPVREVHLFDGDTFFSHNAFRAPGAPTLEQLRQRPRKTAYLTEIYSRMHRGLIDHQAYLENENIDCLQGMDFVFLCLDSGPIKKALVEKLEALEIPFIDVGMGVVEAEGALGGILRVTTSTPARRDHLRGRVSFSDADGGNEYDRNIQIADLNALNAALAVIKWKKMFGFYRDLKQEHHCQYTIDGNLLLNEDRPE
ncbi:ThiF family adenylyltransferase [Geothrix sp. 21YS21S-2]|uniref:ThiF family adenylyltransferase n=1 Tax=Geothrix sp. 21YS21S-2 TaxID=3068893 RepID=UPI0027B8DA21|nr:ThiF family adenylyltransferase [Geothrix sp. 21YS21S-2]